MAKLLKLSTIISSAISKFKKKTEEDLELEKAKKITETEIQKCNKYASILGLPSIKNRSNSYSRLAAFMEEIEKNNFFENDWDKYYYDLSHLIRTILRKNNIPRWDTEKAKDFLQKNCKVLEKSRA